MLFFLEYYFVRGAYAYWGGGGGGASTYDRERVVRDFTVLTNVTCFGRHPVVKDLFLQNSSPLRDKQPQLSLPSQILKWQPTETWPENTTRISFRDSTDFVFVGNKTVNIKHLEIYNSAFSVQRYNQAVCNWDNSYWHLDCSLSISIENRLKGAV